MASEEFDPDQAARISAAIVKAIAEAKVLVDAENVGPELHDVIQHARELHDLLREQVEAAPSAVVDRLRGACEAMGNNIGRLEELLGGEAEPPAVH
jgi:hypothetical protein